MRRWGLRRWGLVIGLVVLVVSAGGLVWRALRPAQPNVLVIVWDTVRADRMSVYGYERPTTPKLAARANDATIFERASSPGIWTLPAHASMFTGLPPESHGADERWLWLDDRFVTIAEHFDQHGYATFTLAANTLLCEETNLVQGFDVRLNTFTGRMAKAARAATQRKLLPEDRSNELAPAWEPPHHGAKNAEWGRAAFKEAAPLVVRTFVEWLDVRKSKEQPFFAFINLMEAHTPRIPSMAAREQVMGDDPELIRLGLATDAGHINLHFYNFGKYDYSARELEAINGVYDATLVDLDNATEALFEALDQRGLLDNTIVVLTSDHGENLGDHHLFNHRFSLWDTLVHVPLLVWAPQTTGGQRVPLAVNTLDLFANVARLADVPLPSGISDGDWFAADEGASVTHLGVPLRREIETVQAVHGDVDVEPWLRGGHAAVTAGYKLIRLTDGTTVVYDLAKDPGETTPVVAPVQEAFLSKHVDSWLAGFPRYNPAERGPRDDPAHVRASQEDLRAQLEALGYHTDDP